MTDAERVEAISVEKALEHTTMRAIVRDFSPDKHNMMILADEVKRLRRVLANEVKCHVEKIDRMKFAEAEVKRLQSENACQYKNISIAQAEAEKMRGVVDAAWRIVEKHPDEWGDSPLAEALAALPAPEPKP